MGVVYKAEDTKLDGTVALKSLAPHPLKDEEANKRFHREAKAAASLHHPNVRPVYEIGGFPAPSKRSPCLRDRGGGGPDLHFDKPSGGSIRHSLCWRATRPRWGKTPLSWPTKRRIDPLASVAAIVSDNTFNIGTGVDGREQVAPNFQIQQVYSIDGESVNLILRGVVLIIGAPPESDLSKLGDPRPARTSLTSAAPARRTRNSERAIERTGGVQRIAGSMTVERSLTTDTTRVVETVGSSSR